MNKGKAADGADTEFPYIHEIGDFGLIKKLNKAAIYSRYNERRKAWVNTDPPQNVAKMLRDSGRKALPVLVGFLNAPTLRDDGSILDKSGFDDATGLLLDMGGVVFPEIPNKPALDEAMAAVDVLRRPIREFPFVSAADEGVALAAMLTAAIRRALPPCPGFWFTAPMRGSGKSKLTSVCSVIASGRPATVISQGHSDEEFEKRLGACQMDGRPHIAIDNCTRPLTDFAYLCSLLSETEASPRILGQSKAPALPTNVLITATGNNLALTGDMTRRGLLCTIDPRCERPELRDFSFDPVVMAMRTRPQLVAAA